MHLLAHVHTLDLSRSCVADVSALGGVHTLNLAKTSVVDVSALGGVHTLNVSHTPVSDVSTDVRCLVGVHTLNLSMTHVTDVSMLGRVDTLLLHGCKLVDGVSALGAVRVLDITRIKKSARGMGELQGVEELSIHIEPDTVCPRGVK